MTDYESVVFPLDSFREAAIHLRRPFTPQAVKWKVQSTFGEKGCLVVGYIDARLVVERLNLILPDRWSDVYVPVDGSTLRCDLTVDGITRSDVGVGAGFQAAKAAYSDALKRAAVKFGVGVSLYAIPQALLWREEFPDYIKLRKNNKGEPSFDLTPDGVTALANRYEKWLKVHGEEAFGPALDHGDVEVSVGDPDVVEQPEPQEEESAGALVEGDQADELRRKCLDIYQTIVAVAGKASFPRGQFDAALDSAGASIEGLQGFARALQSRLENAREKVPA
jgi:hypothetical protein